MSAVEFQDGRRESLARPRHMPFLTRVLINLKLAKDEQGANNLLVIITIIIFLASGVFWWKLFNSNFDLFAPRDVESVELIRP